MERVRKILLTHGHGDHAGGARVLSDRLGDRVYAMEPAAGFIRAGDIEHLSLVSAIEAGVYEKGYRFSPCEVLPVCDGERIEVGALTLQAVASEGHSAGHCCYVMQEGSSKVLFAGDSVQCGGKIALQAIWDCDLQKYIATIRKLNELRPDMLLPAHGAFALSRGSVHLQKACSILDTLALPKNTIGE
jgi:glyoxylase-like metal-dependent hydrolase (beta-lactamase superfamily II)